MKNVLYEYHFYYAACETFSLHSFKHKDNVKNEKQKNWLRPIMSATTQHFELRKIIKNLRTLHLLFCITCQKLGIGMSAVYNIS
jgi:hypothetical protein